MHRSAYRRNVIVLKCHANFIKTATQFILDSTLLVLYIYIEREIPSTNQSKDI